MTAPTEPTGPCLVVARVSREADTQVSIERQESAAKAYAATIGDASPILVADRGVSGGKSPFRRPALGPYLTDRPPGEWRTIVVEKLDRLGRNAQDLRDLVVWLEKRNKQVVILSPRLILPAPEGEWAMRLTWQIMAELAQIELEQTRARYAATKDYLREAGSFLGKAPWYTRIVGSNGRKTLALVPERAEIMRRIVAEVLAGKGPAEIARQLTAERVPAPNWVMWEQRKALGKATGKHPAFEWSDKTIAKQLRHEALCGVYSEGGREIRFDPIVSRDTFEQVQARLDGIKAKRGATRRDAWYLSGIAFCSVCSSPLHGRVITEGKPKKDGTYTTHSYYRCDARPPHRPSTCQNMIPAGHLEAVVDRALTADDMSLWADPEGTFGPNVNVASLQVVELVRVAPDDNSAAIAELQADAARVAKTIGADPEALTKLGSLQDRITELQSKGATGAYWEERPTGKTVAEHWATLTPAERRQYLLDAGVKVFAASERAALRAGHDEGQLWLSGNPARVVGRLQQA